MFMRFNWSSRVKCQNLTAKACLSLGEVVYRQKTETLTLIPEHSCSNSGCK